MTKSPRVAKPPSPTEQLIAELEEHGGEIHVSSPDRARYEARVAAAIRYGKVPARKHLVTQGSRWTNDYVVRLEDRPAWMNAQLDPIPIPATLRQPHPVVIALQVGNRLNGIDRSVSHRALLLVQALAVEARKRGYSARETMVTTNPYGYEERESKDHFSITIGQYRVGVQLRQMMNRARHEATPAEKAKAASDKWYRIPKFDVTPSDRLSVQLSGRFEHRQSKWTDGRLGTLENWLPQILQEVELRSAGRGTRKARRHRRGSERRGLWERAMEKAKDDYAEAHRSDLLLRQLDGWFRARQVPITSTPCRRPSTASPTPMTPSLRRNGSGGLRSGRRRLTHSDSPWRCPWCPNRTPRTSRYSSRAGAPTVPGELSGSKRGDLQKPSRRCETCLRLVWRRWGRSWLAELKKIVRARPP